MSRKPEIQPKPRRALSHKLRTSENGPGIQWVDGNEGAQPNDPQRSVRWSGFSDRLAAKISSPVWCYAASLGFRSGGACPL